MAESPKHRRLRLRGVLAGMAACGIIGIAGLVLLTLTGPLTLYETQTTITPGYHLKSIAPGRLAIDTGNQRMVTTQLTTTITSGSAPPYANGHHWKVDILGASLRVSQITLSTRQTADGSTEFRISADGAREISLCIPAGILLALWITVAVVPTLRYRKRLKAGCCGHCGYDCRGLRSDRCPECGRSTPAVSADYEHCRRRLRRSLVSTMVFVAVVAAPLAAQRWVPQATLYTFRRPSVLIGEISSEDAAISSLASKELDRRDANGALSTAAIDQLANHLMESQKYDQDNITALTDRLDALFLDGRLDRQMRDVFLTNLVRLGVDHYGPSYSDYPVSIAARMHVNSRTPAIRDAIHVDYVELQLDGEPVDCVGVPTVEDLADPPFHRQFQLPPMDPGQHELTWVLIIHGSPPVEDLPPRFEATETFFVRPNAPETPEPQN